MEQPGSSKLVDMPYIRMLIDSDYLKGHVGIQRLRLGRIKALVGEDQFLSVDFETLVQLFHKANEITHAELDGAVRAPMPQAFLGTGIAVHNLKFGMVISCLFQKSVAHATTFQVLDCKA